jgi:hypothetical protein
MKDLEEELNLKSHDVQLTDVPEDSSTTEIDMLNDYKIVRHQIKVAIVRSGEVLDEAVRMVKALPMPQQITAAAAVIKSLAENAEKLITVHEKIRAIERDSGVKKDTVTDKPTTKHSLKNVLQMVKDQSAEG